MLSNLRVAWSLATLPVHTLYAGYKGLAWVFDSPCPPAPRARAVVPVGEGAAVPAHADAAPVDGELTLSEKTRARLLKLGFTASTLMWIPAAYGAAVAHDLNWVSDGQAWMGLAWLAAASWVVSVLMLRKTGKKEAARESASPVARARRAVAAAAGAVGAAAGAVKDAPFRAVNAVRSAPGRAADAVRGAPGHAAAAARGAAERVVGAAGRCVEHARARLAGWGKKTPAPDSGCPRG